MPGRVFLDTPVDALAATLGAAAEPGDDTAPRPDIAPGAQLRVLTPDRRLTAMRWGMIPVGRKNARGRPVMETIVNARSETVFDKSAFASVGRGIVPVSGWYEWTGPARRKTRWRIAPRDGGLLYFAAITDIWRAPGGTVLPQVATVTTEPNGDVRDIHHRMAAILAVDEIDQWLHGDETQARALLRPLPDGLLKITELGVDR